MTPPPNSTKFENFKPRPPTAPSAAGPPASTPYGPDVKWPQTSGGNSKTIKLNLKTPGPVAEPTPKAPPKINWSTASTPPPTPSSAPQLSSQSTKTQTPNAQQYYNYPQAPPTPPVAPPSTDLMLRRPPETGFFRSLRTLFGKESDDFAFWIIPRGYGLTGLALAGCYWLLLWEQMKVTKLAKKPQNQKSANWYTNFQRMDREYHMAKKDFVRVLMLGTLGGLRMPYFSAVGALFWCAGRATRFVEAEEVKLHKLHMSAPDIVDFEDPMLCRMGKILMFCGVCKLGIDWFRGRLALAP